MRAVYLIFATGVAVFGAFKLYNAVRHNGNFEAYATGLYF
jgi:hypothetical protein